IDILIVSNKSEKIEAKVSEEVFKVILNNKEFISAHVMSESKLDKLKNFSFLKNIKKEGIILG
ncbi:MAG: nucleotidyltransferase domain-containing protein, partial [archaeon]|nr:nucleotidyltransferase domain-containing protein [archaeon]